MTDNAKQEREGVDFDKDAATAAYLLGVTHGRDGGRLVGLIHRIIDRLLAYMFKDNKDWDQ